MSRLRKNTANYTKLSNEESEKDELDGFSDEQFKALRKTFPWKAVVFIILFMIAGAICLACGIMISTGHIDKKYEDRAWPLLILGILMFIPGGYYGYILLCICLRREGFTLEEIPAF